MNQSRCSRPVSQLSAATNHKLNLYALAATSAGVGLLALAQPAEAKIVYTKTHHVIGLNHPYKLDLTHNGTTDFLIQETQTGSTGFKANHLGAKVAMGNAVEGYLHTSSRGYAAALKGGAPIGGRQGFVSKGRHGEVLASVRQSDTVFYNYGGQWTNVTGYLGLKFKIHGKTHYGWARLIVVDDGFMLTGTLTGYAYETVANKAIIAGRTQGKDEVQPASLGHLAHGASAVAAWRLKQVAVTTR